MDKVLEGGQAIIQTVTLSEFCRIVIKTALKRGEWGSRALGARAKTMEDGKRLETPLKIPRYRGNGIYERCGSELERPYLSP